MLLYSIHREADQDLECGEDGSHELHPPNFIWFQSGSQGFPYVEGFSGTRLRPQVRAFSELNLLRPGGFSLR